jgi:MFS family permease
VHPVTDDDAPQPPRRRSPFYGLITGYLISELGTAMSGIAIPWLVLITTGSPAKTGLIGFAEMAPYVLLQAGAGPLVDRIGLRRTAITGNAIAAVLMGLIPILHGAGALNLGGLAALVAVAGAVRGAADASTSPFVPATTAMAQLPIERATGLYSAANRLGLLLGVPVAGVLIAASSPATVVLIDAITFAVAALLFATLIPADARPDTPAEEPASVRGYLRQLGEGMRFLRGDRLLLGLVAMIAVTNLLDEAFSAVFVPVWVHTRLHETAGLGVIGGSAGAGLLAGVLLGAWLVPRLPRHTVFAVGMLLAGSPAFVALALSSTLPPVVVVVVLSGLAGGMLNPIIGAVQFERVPAPLQARVLGAIKASAWIGVPVGSLVGGLVTEAAGLRTALLLAGAVMVAATLAPFVFPVWRQLNRPGDGAARS